MVSPNTVFRCKFRQAVSKILSPAMKPRHDCPNRNVKHLGNFFVGKTLNIRQKYNHTLIFRQSFKSRTKLS